MPIYEYECRKCKAHTEVLQKMTDKPLTKCSRCGGRLEKQWSATGFQFVGSGWYVTDYAAKKSDVKEEKKGASKEAPAGGDQNSGKESKKPATTTNNSTTTATKTTSSNNTGGD